jgi:hypothetical protein
MVVVLVVSVCVCACVCVWNCVILGLELEIVGKVCYENEFFICK